jgi:hypothetical protein
LPSFQFDHKLISAKTVDACILHIPDEADQRSGVMSITIPG